MIKRPLNMRFKDAVLEGRKVTTIRENAWPVGVPIMLYHWTGKPYRSNHADVAVIEVVHVTPILITHLTGGEMTYAGGPPESRNPIYLIQPYAHTLWSAEGFASQEEMDAWFRKVVKHGHQVEQNLMRFRMVNPVESQA